MDDLDRRLRTDSVRIVENEESNDASSNAATGETRMQLQPAGHEDECSETAKVDEERREKARALVKKRIVASRNGNLSPLANLAGREAALEAHHIARARLAKSDAVPDKTLLGDQLMGAPRIVTGNSHLQMRKRAEVVALFAALDSKDAIETMLDRLMVASNTAAMDCFIRAAQTNEPRARALNLRYGFKGTETFCTTLKLRESRRGQNTSKVVVGNVNVESGGQAIVGQVKTAARAVRSSKSRGNHGRGNAKTKS
jgi:hypothetical protein